MSTELNQPAITARIIPNNRRMAFLPRLFGATYLTGEAGVYNLARSLRRLSRRFPEFVELSCGSGFMYPLSAERLRYRLAVTGSKGNCPQKLPVSC